MGFVSRMEQANNDKAKYGGGRSVSIAERRAAKCGFNAERINTPRFRKNTASPLPSPADRSPGHLTLPPGISPTALLDSPMMLPNSQVIHSVVNLGNFHFYDYGPFSLCLALGLVENC